MQKYSSLSDDLLIRKIKSDDIDAFNELYRRYSTKLVNYVFSKVQDLNESEDIVQEIFVYLWVNKETLFEFDSISNYLYTIALNKSLNIFKRAKVKEIYINSLAIYLGEPSYNLEDVNLEDERDKRLKDALSLLPEKMRLVFDMRYFLGYSNQQVAEVMGLSIHTVSTQMKRALKAIRENLDLIVFLYLINKL